MDTDLTLHEERPSYRIEHLEEEQKRLKHSLQQIQHDMKDLKSAVRTRHGSGHAGVRTLTGTLTNYAKKTMTSLLQQSLNGAIGGARASGGAVGAHTPYMVGERGPEMFVPTHAGQIVPHHALSKSAPVHVTMHVHTSDAGSFRRSEAQIMAELANGVRRSAKRLR
jgi:phage-related minor tail protein